MKEIFIAEAENTITSNINCEKYTFANDGWYYIFSNNIEQIEISAYGKEFQIEAESWSGSYKTIKNVVEYINKNNFHYVGVDNRGFNAKPEE